MSQRESLSAAAARLRCSVTRSASLRASCSFVRLSFCPARLGSPAPRAAATASKPSEPLATIGGHEGSPR
eukprot:4069803-Prymnesium_polylepis.1